MAGRVEISFLGFTELTYELYFRETLSSPLHRVSFATTPGGPLSTTELAGADNFQSFFVERPAQAGFFQVAMKAGEV
jgi:hypothetical protein